MFLDLIYRINFTMLTSFNIVLFTCIDDVKEIKRRMTEGGATTTQAGHFYVDSGRQSQQGTKSSSYNYSDMVWYCSLAWVAVVLKTYNGALHALGIVLMNIETRLLLFLLPSCGFFDLQKRWLGLMHAMGLPVATSCILFILLAHCNHSNISLMVSALAFITCTPQPNII